MKPIKFLGHNVVFAEDQKEYLPLPALVIDDLTISCWQLTLMERLMLLFTGKLWLSQLNFGQPLQPQLPSVKCPFTFGVN